MTAASRLEAERLREARCPQAAYGSRVHRRIRGRWFSLVPIRLRSMILVTASLSFLVTTLCIAHYAAIAWPTLAAHPTIARPLRLDRPDSFGRWCMLVMLTATAGVALLIYQLRRYRNDDFRGHYRLWRLVIIVTLLASVNTLVSMLEWGGAILDAGFGKRVALAGSDWIRLVVTFGGAVLTLRMIAEIRHCRTALIMLLVSCVMFAIPEAVKWNILKVESMGYWTLATTAPILGCTSLLISMLTYLRMLYRDVKQVEQGSLMDQFHQLRMKLFRPWETENDENAKGEFSATTSQRGTQGNESNSKRKRQAKPTVDTEGHNIKQDRKTAKSDSGMKRRWFGLRKAKAAAGATASNTKTDTQAKKSPPDETRKKRRRSSLILKPRSTTSNQRSTSNPPGDTSTSTDVQRKGLFGWRRKQDTIDSESSTQKNPSKPPQTTEQVREQKEHPSPQDEPIATGNIDWASMSKAERRRLRKQLKRQKRAA